MTLESDIPEPSYKRKAHHSGILIQAWQKTKEALGSPKFEAPNDPHFACPYDSDHWVDYDEEYQEPITLYNNIDLLQLQEGLTRYIQDNKDFVEI